MENYFDKSKNQSSFIKILVGIIILQFIINVGMFKGLLDVTGDKTFKFEVPSFLESGEYAIGTTFANDNVYKMWTKLWVNEMSNFSYKDVRQRVSSVMDFLAPATAYKNKSELLKFIDFIEENYVTQEFSVRDFEIKDSDKPGYKEISWTGELKRQIGLKTDPLSNLKYTYTFTCFTRNGQIYIHNLSLVRTDDKDVKVKKFLENNEFVNYDVYVPEKKN